MLFLTGGADSGGPSRFRLKRGSEASLLRNTGHQQQHHQRSDMEALLTRRRGSLPVEMLSISCSGELD